MKIKRKKNSDLSTPALQYNIMVYTNCSYIKIKYKKSFLYNLSVDLVKQRPVHGAQTRLMRIIASCAKEEFFCS